MARKQVLISDLSGEEIPDGKGQPCESRSRTRVTECAGSTWPTQKRRSSAGVRSHGADAGRRQRRTGTSRLSAL